MDGDLNTPIFFPDSTDCANGKLFATSSGAAWIETSIASSTFNAAVTEIGKDGSLSAAPTQFQIHRPNQEILEAQLIPSSSGGYFALLVTLDRLSVPTETIKQEVLKFDHDGSIDPSFNPPSPLFSRPNEGGVGYQLTMAEASNGMLLLAYIYRENEENVLAAIQLFAEGNPDTRFGPNGRSDLLSRPSSTSGYQSDVAEMIHFADDGGAYLAVRRSIQATNTSYLYGIKLKGNDLPQSVSPEGFLPERFSLSPNPTASSTTVRLTLASPTEVSLSVYDALGRIVHTRPSETLRAGDTALHLDTHSFPPGVYAVVVRAGDEQTTSLLTVTR